MRLPRMIQTPSPGRYGLRQFALRRGLVSPGLAALLIKGELEERWSYCLKRSAAL